MAVRGKFNSRNLFRFLLLLNVTFSLSSTVEPRFNEPLFNEVLDITNDILCPSQSYTKIYGIKPWYNETWYNEFFDITNIIQQPKRKIYLDITSYNVKTRRKININCCWFLFSSMYHFLFKFCYALNANCVWRNWRDSWLSLMQLCLDCKRFWQWYWY